MRSRYDRRPLSNNLKASEAGRLIVRKKYPQIPPKVEFSLSKCDKTLMKVLTQLCVQGSENRLPGEQALCRPQKNKTPRLFQLQTGLPAQKAFEKRTGSRYNKGAVVVHSAKNQIVRRLLAVY